MGQATRGEWTQLGDKLNEYVKAAKKNRISLVKIAKEIGYPRQSLYRYLNGTDRMPLKAIEKFGYFLQLSSIQVDELKRLGEYNSGSDPFREDIKKIDPIYVRKLEDPIATFLGRKKEITKLLAFLKKAPGQSTAVAGIYGMGGVGKTQLALVVAGRLRATFPDQFFVNLSGMRGRPLESFEVLQRAIREIAPEIGPLPPNTEDLKKIYRNQLSGRSVLLIADDALNVSQVRLLIPPSGSALMVTSRRQILLEGCEDIDLKPFDPPKSDVKQGEAEELLLLLYPAIDLYAQHLAKLCGYLPLALQISAGYLRKMQRTTSIKDYLSDFEQEQNLELLQSPDPDDTALNVRASLMLSYKALDQEAQKLLRLLGVFAGSFTHQAVKTISMLSSNNILNSLGEWNLLESRAESNRLQLHDLVRAFALEQLKGAGEEYALRLRYGTYYAEVAQEVGQLFKQPSSAMAASLKLFDQERLHIDSAWIWAQNQPSATGSDKLLVGFANATLHFSPLRYHPQNERLPKLEAAVNAAQRLELQAVNAAQRLELQKAQGWLLGSLGTTYLNLGNNRKAVDYYEKALSFGRDYQEPRLEGAALGSLGIAYRYLGDLKKVIFFSKQWREFARKLEDPRSEGYALGALGSAYAGSGDFQQAILYHEEYLSLASKDNPRGEGAALNLLAVDHQGLGNLRQAITYAERALKISREISDSPSESAALNNLGWSYMHLGEGQQAIDRYLKDALKIKQLKGDQPGEGLSLEFLGTAYLLIGEPLQARECYNQALVIFRKLEDRRGEGKILNNIGQTYAALGDFLLARDLYIQSLSIVREVDDKPEEGQILANLAQVYIELRSNEPIVEYFEQAIEIAHNFNDRLKEAERRWNYGMMLESQGKLVQAAQMMQMRVDYEQYIEHCEAKLHAAYLEQIHRKLE